MVETDIHELGDRRLNPEEGVIRERESLLKKVSMYRVDGQDELEDKKRQYGARISFQSFISRLQKLNSQLSARDGSPGNIALYAPRTPEELNEALREGGQNDIFFIFNKYVGGFPKCDIPEYGYLDLDTSLLPTREGWMDNGKFVQGHSWRSVLMGLIKAGVISYQSAINEFGDPSLDPRSTRWFKELGEWRKSSNIAITRRQLDEQRLQH